MITMHERIREAAEYPVDRNVARRIYRQLTDFERESLAVNALDELLQHERRKVQREREAEATTATPEYRPAPVRRPSKSDLQEVSDFIEQQKARDKQKRDTLFERYYQERRFPKSCDRRTRQDFKTWCEELGYNFTAWLDVLDWPGKSFDWDFREPWERMTAAIEQYRVDVRLELTQELLGSEFALGDGRTVTWGEATAEDHQQRIEMLTKSAGGTLQTAARHQAALDLLQDSGAPTLGAVQVAA